MPQYPPDASCKVSREAVWELGRALLASTHVEQAIVTSWLTIALRRDALGDFARGIGRLPTVLERVETGHLNHHLEIDVQQLSPVSARVSAPHRHWPDQVGQYAADLAVKMAHEQSIGLAAFPKPNIVGATLEPVIRAGLLGVVFVQNAPLLNYPGVSTHNLVGNNPIALCAPGDPPFLFDSALSQYSLASLVDVARQEMIPPGAVLDAHGMESVDPRIATHLAEGASDGGSLRPLGGIKGLGLAMGVEFLAGALTGGFYAPPQGKPWGEGALVIVLSGRLFGVEQMTSQISTYLSQFTSYPGLHAQSVSTASSAQEMLTYPKRVLSLLNTAAGKRGLATLHISI